MFAIDLGPDENPAILARRDRQQLSEGVIELFRRDRLQQPRIGTAGISSPDLRRHVSADDNDGDLPEREVPTNPGAELVASHVGKVELGDQQIDLLLTVDPEPFFGRGGGEDAKIVPSRDVLVPSERITVRIYEEDLFH